jgi:hypothetical protein
MSNRALQLIVILGLGTTSVFMSIRASQLQTKLTAEQKSHLSDLDLCARSLRTTTEAEGSGSFGSASGLNWISPLSPSLGTSGVMTQIPNLAALPSSGTSSIEIKGTDGTSVGLTCKHGRLVQRRVLKPITASSGGVWYQ